MVATVIEQNLLENQPKIVPILENISPCLELINLVTIHDAMVPIKAPILARDPIHD